jgi:hypothetical protein
MSDTFLDRPNPCPCPTSVIELLALAVQYAEASFGSERTDVSLGAHYVKTFMEQPANEWCAFIGARAAQEDA